MAVLARHAQEAVIEHAAAQELVELLAHVLGHGAILLREPLEEVRVMRLHQRVQQGALGRVARVARRGRGHCRRRRAHHGLPPERDELRHGTLLCSDGSSGLRPPSRHHIGVSLIRGSEFAATRAGRFRIRPPQSTKPGTRPGSVV